MPKRRHAEQGRQHQRRGARRSSPTPPTGKKTNQPDQARSLSKGDVLQSASAVNGTTRNDNPLNPVRYSAKRYDTGSQTLDTGARRFDLGSGRFIQPDLFRGALDDLGLATDPLNQNRYAD